MDIVPGDCFDVTLADFDKDSPVVILGTIFDERNP